MFKRKFQSIKISLTGVIFNEEISQACKKAYIHNFIMSQDKQYEKMIEENGVTISFQTNNKGYIVEEENTSYVGEHVTALAMLIKHKSIIKHEELLEFLKHNKTQN